MSDLDSIERMMRINGRINAAMLEGLELSDWDLTDGLGGQSVRFQLAHIAHFRYGWIKELAPEFIGKARPTMKRAEDGTIQLIVHDPEDLKAVFVEGDEAAINAVKNAKMQDKSLGKYFDQTMLLARTLAHDANHRGLIMSVLRINGIKRPEITKAMYGLWGEE